MTIADPKPLDVDILTMTEIAVLAGVKAHTAERWKIRGVFIEQDDYVGGAPVRRLERVTEWLRARPTVSCNVERWREARERGGLHDADACEVEAVRRASLFSNAIQNAPMQIVSLALSSGLFGVQFRQRLCIFLHRTSGAGRQLGGDISLQIEFVEASLSLTTQRAELLIDELLLQ